MKEHGLDGSGLSRRSAQSMPHARRARRRRRAASDRRGRRRARVAGCVEPLELSPSKITEVQTLTPRSTSRRCRAPSRSRSSCERLDARLRRELGEHGPVQLARARDLRSGAAAAGWPELNGFYADGRRVAHRVGRDRFRSESRAGRCACRSSRTRRELSLARRRARGARPVAALHARRAHDRRRRGRHVHDHGSFGARASCTSCRCSTIGSRRFSASAPSAADGTRDLVLTFDHRLSDGMRAAHFPRSAARSARGRCG